MCTKMIINVGISEVVFNVDYFLGDIVINLFKMCGINVCKYVYKFGY